MFTDSGRNKSKFSVDLVTKGIKVDEKPLFASKSYSTDRYTPCVEKIILPSYTLPDGNIRASLTEGCFVSKSKDLGKLGRTLALFFNRLAPFEIQNDLIIDFRTDSPGNWSHVLNAHLPFSFFLEDSFKNHARGGRPIYLLSSDTPSYIKNLFQFFDKEVVFTDRPVKGQFIDFHQTRFGTIRSIIHVWMREYVFQHKSFLDLTNKNTDIPKKVFFSRKDTRKLKNEKNVVSLFSDFGYETVYAEDLSVEEQLLIYIHSTDIAAIHGAAMGPLIYRPSNMPPLNVVEIFSPGHVTNFYRGMCDLIGANWVGVRGCFEPKHIRGLYNFKRPYLEHSLTDFTVDLESLALAISYLSQKK